MATPKDDPFAAVRVPAVQNEDPFAAVRSKNTELMQSGEVTKNVPRNLKSHYENLGFIVPAAAIAGGFMGGGGLTKALGVPMNPVASAGAGLAASGGEAVRQIASTALGAFGGEAGVPDGTGALLEAQGKAGTAAAIAELGGQQIVRGLGWLGKGAGGIALKATPEVVQTAIKEGIEASQSGLRKATGKIVSLAKDARQIAAAATQGGVRLDVPRGIADPVMNKLGAEIIDSGVNVSERLEVLEKIGKRVVRDNPGQSTPLKVLAFRQGADSEAKAIYTAQARGQYVPPTQLEEARIWKELADHAREFVNQIPGQFKSKAGTMADVNARNSALIQVKDAVRRVARPGAGFRERLGAGLAGRGIAAGVGGAIAMAGGENHLPGGPLMRFSEGAIFGGLAGSPSVMMGVARATNSRVIKKGVPTLLQISAHGLQPAKQGEK